MPLVRNIFAVVTKKVHMRSFRTIALSFLIVGTALLPMTTGSTTEWHLNKQSEALVTDAKLQQQMFQALDAAQKSGTDPHISHFQVRVATVVEKDGEDHIVLGGNSEYDLPEGIHGETSVLNHAIALYGAESTRKNLRFLAFYADKCGGGGSCGDCRDYQMVTTDYQNLLVVCGQSSDHSVTVTKFADQIVCEKQFPEVNADKIPLSKNELTKLVLSAEEARKGGVTLFTSDRHTGAAGLSDSGKIYRSAGADDAAFHYRYPISGLLQQAATERDYFLRAIVVSGEEGKWPVVNYRDRQYGYESSSFNRKRGKPPIQLILSNGRGQYRMTTFEASLPQAFSTADFMPEALDRFLETHAPKK